MQRSIPCTMMRGGTSKGAYFLASDLPADTARARPLLLAVMGSPDPRQIDGIGGADPLTSKVAVVSTSSAARHRRRLPVPAGLRRSGRRRPTQQNCGNILAGVAPFAIERGLVRGRDGETKVRIFMVNTGQTVVATVQTPGRRADYDGDARIDGVPGTARADSARASPTRPAPRAARCCRPADAVDVIDGVEVTLHRQRHARRRDARRRSRPHRLRDARRARRRHRAQGAHRGDPADGRADDEPRRRHREDGAEDDPGRAAARRRRRLDALVHPASRPRDDRRVRGAVSVATACLLPGEPGARHRARSPTAPPRRCSSSTRPAPARCRCVEQRRRST